MTRATYRQQIAVALFVIVGSGIPSFALSRENDVVITNLKFGLVCGPNENRRICFETGDIQLTNESQCTYNGRNVPCTWYGYSFDYQLPKEEIKLECEWSSTLPTNIGNPNVELQKNASTIKYEVTLKRDSHYFFNPQYSALPPQGRLGFVERTKQSCSYMGKNLFEVMFQLYFPEH